MIELVLTIILGIGVLLFLVSYLTYIVTGFKHHFVTGVIAALPVLNVVTLPSLWDKGRGKFLMGLVGLVLAGGSWILGANKTVNNYLAQRNNISAETVIRSADNTQRIVTNNGNASNNLTSPRTQYNPIDESKMLGLPSKALYSMHFDPVPVNQISTLQGRIVKITNQQNEEIEGRIKAVSASSVVVEGEYENEIPIATIKQVLLMVKKANR
ncbi:hypothetical protein OO007_04000 [Cocleimonas sp. KMM 6892]|uniref:hypothetical protein n=1 Tax=unclassified Cocleimonas TaxID=2639732 RepID=UPI002DBB1420|nr:MULTISPECIES: hypothetical protein [unclassified Cocleimonas]MEB8431378.1 hypothetical protein [Cocleimonas sp. KMM 6892]MEC4713850.1 hypothetical protein [Cocleimonas sp. KMM 6895]MEC4743181.1 hypothetical protein [Cocleimonas sp. KMM 6896]